MKKLLVGVLILLFTLAIFSCSTVSKLYYTNKKVMDSIYKEKKGELKKKLKASAGEEVADIVDGVTSSLEKEVDGVLLKAEAKAKAKAKAESEAK